MHFNYLLLTVIIYSLVPVYIYLKPLCCYTFRKATLSYFNATEQPGKSGLTWNNACNDEARYIFSHVKGDFLMCDEVY